MDENSEVVAVKRENLSVLPGKRIVDEDKKNEEVASHVCEALHNFYC